ncbi:MAG: CoA pyrophosphatase [Pseudorhodoplanes sp.]|uniref:CoA pyrophosphatase n=1 Tax=Pseudorhodoplanes sp. TaxID=1934341 RepID=UPI003D0D63AC
MVTQAAPSQTLSHSDFFDRARAVLTLDPPLGLTDPEALPLRGDHDADPVVKAMAAVRPIKPAAVLIPVIDRDEPMVLLTQRTAHLPQHAGQIAFPGGKIDATDATPLAAALREAEEEVGLDASVIDPIGYLDVYMTTLGYRIVPVVARVHPEFKLILNPGEVEDTFEVPLSFMMELTNHQTHSREWQGMMRSYYAIPFGERYIWGVTAGIFRNLHEKVYGA